MLELYMADSAIYFPYIEVPESLSLARVLLYWDTLGSIIPAGVRRSSRLERLIELGLVVPIDPHEHGIFDPSRSRHFRSELATLIEQHSRAAGATDDGPTSAGHAVWIEAGKADWPIWDTLADHGLAHIPNEVRYSHRGGIAVDRDFGGMYLALLALTLGRLRSLRMDPITDEPAFFRLVGGAAETEQAHSLDRMRGALLRHVLPSPAEIIDPGDLAQFKADHSDLLRRLRQHVEAELLDCAREPDEELRDRLLELSGQRLASQVDEVRRRMDEHGWPSAQDGLCAVLQGLPGVAAGFVTGRPAIGATGVIPLVIEIVRSAFPRDSLRDDPVFYAALASDRFNLIR